MVLTVITGGALLGARLVQNPSYKDGFAGCCNDNCACACWGNGTDKSWYCSTCKGQTYDASTDSCQGSSSTGGGTTGSTGGSTTGGYNQAQCASRCSQIKSTTNGGVVSGRKNASKNEGGVAQCECYCSVGGWDSSFSTCVGGQTSNDNCTNGATASRDGCTYQCVNSAWVEINCGGTTATGGTSNTGGTTNTGTAVVNSTQNKSAGDACNPQATGGLPQNGGCDGSGPLSCIVCPGGTNKSGLNICSTFDTAQKVANDCGGYTTGNTSTPSKPVGDTDLICNSSSQSNCSSKNVGATCIASGNATGYCTQGATSGASTTCSCETADNNPIYIGSGAECTGGQWNVYECNRVNTEGGCQDKFVGTFDNEGVSRAMSQVPACTTRQADCIGSSPLVFRSVINNPGASVCESTTTNTTNTTTTTGTGGTTNTTNDTTNNGTDSQTTDQTFYCADLSPSVNAPKIGDTVYFTCSAGGLGASQVNRYEFQYKVDNGQFQSIGISSINKSVSLGITISEPGVHLVQCRACSSSRCTDWDTL